MGAVMYSETSVLIYQCTRRHIPCDGSLTHVFKQLSSPGVHGSTGAGTHSGDVLRLPSAERRHVEQEVGVQQRVQAARVREERRAVGPKEGLVNGRCTRVGTLTVATIYLQLIQNRYMFRSFTVLQFSHQHCVQPVASDVEVVGYL